jgi:hypothetical protein
MATMMMDENSAPNKAAAKKVRKKIRIASDPLSLPPPHYY